METYLFKFSACLVVFWLVYILFLERQTMHRFKRFYLLGAIASALVIPTLTVTEYVEPVPSDFEVSTVYVPLQPSLIEQPQEQAPFFDLETVLWMLYGLGVFVFVIRFIVNLFRMYKRISVNKQIEKRPFIYVLLEECRIPHSFFKYLFFERSKYETDTIPNEVKLHEETHARQLHSLDIITIELLQIVFWFHPLLYILKHHIKLNHEFLADQAVLDEGVDTKAYQKTLLQFSSNAQEYQLSSTINYSSIKKRFTVMKTQTSKTRMWLSSLLLIPIIAILFYSFAERDYIEKATLKTDEISIQSADLKQHNPPTQKEIEAYNAWAKKIHAESKVLSDDATFFPPINEQDLIKFSETYKSMTPQQKNQSIEFPFSGLELKDSEKNISFDSIQQENQIKILKSNKNKNIILLEHWYITINNNKYYYPYKKGDLRRYYDNYGSEVDLDIVKEYQKKHKAFEALKNTGKHYVYKSKEEQKEIERLFSDLGGMYFRMSKNNKTKVERPISPFKPYVQVTLNGKTYYKKSAELTAEERATLPAAPVPAKKQEKATAKQVAAYNAWAKSINKQMAKAKETNDVNAYPIVKVKEVNTYKAIYAIMTEAQRKNSEAWPSFPPLPFSPAKKNDQNKKTINPIEITIKKDNSLILNGKPIAFKDLATSVGFMNNHLTIEERRTYAMASIIIEQNNSLDFSKKVQRELLKAEIASSSVGYAESQQKEGLPTKHYSPNAGLTIAEAKAQQKQALKDYKVYEQKQKSAKKKSPWSVGVGVNSVELINDSQRKSGPIEINGASYYFSQLNGKTTYYDNYGKEVDISKIPPPPPIPNKATPEQKAKMKKATDAYMKANPNKVGKAKAKDGEVFDVIEVPEDLQGSVNINGETFYYTSSAGKTTYFNSKGKEVKMDNLPPPPPSKNPSFLEYIIEMEEKGATFFMDGKKITANEAKTIAKNNKGKGTDMLTQKDENGKYVVKLSKQVKD